MANVSDTAVNSVAASAEMLINIRYTENENIENILGKIKALSPKLGVEVLHHGTPLIVDEKNPYVVKLKKILEKTAKRKIGILHEHGASDARFFADKGIPVLIFGPMGGGYHADDEYVDIKSLETMKETIIEFIESL